MKTARHNKPVQKKLRPLDALAALPGMSAIASASAGESAFGNIVVQADNATLLNQAQTALRGSVRCVYLDPPYNNNETYTHYNDRWNHDRWLENLRACLNALPELLEPSGSVWISIDDSHVHHVRLIGEQVFGRSNFVTTVIWNHRKTRENRKVFSNNHEYVLCFAKDISAFKKARNQLPGTSAMAKRYRNPDDDPRGLWQSVSANVQAGHATPAQFYTVESPSGLKFDPPKGRCWAYNAERMSREIAAGNIYFGKHGRSAPRIKKFLSDMRGGINPDTLWLADEVGTTDSAKKHVLNLLGDVEVFDTPKPEELIHRILQIATNPGDVVLDPYLGSGTTAAVALKTGRVFIGIEEGAHSVSHSAKRLQLVVNGEQGGISKLVGWHGGSGFSFYELKEPMSSRRRSRVPTTQLRRRKHQKDAA